MISRIHQKLGTAGFIISIVALVAALGGGAYAASGGLSGKQKKEVAKIAQTEAKKFAKVGPAGPQGPAGATGAAGAAGAKGDAGSSGGSGSPGQNGASVTSTSLPEGEEPCEFGGSEFKVGGNATFACNGAPGEPGSPWTHGGTLPSGATESGSWSATVDSTGQGRSSISFSVPLAADIPSAKVHLISVKNVLTEGGALPAGCENANGAVSTLPITPDPGNLCIWVNDVEGTVPFGSVQISNPLFPANTHGSAGPEGALMEVGGTEGQFSFGTWAVAGE